MRKGPIELLIADKNPLVLNGLREFFERDERFHLVATAADGERFLEATNRLDFQVGIIGWEMPYMNGREVLEAVKKLENAPRIIVYTGSANPDIPRQIMASGGAGFCSKSENPERLMETVIQVAEGKMVFPFMDMMSAPASPLEGLTPREVELLAALASGKSNAQIAAALEVSLNTVKFHLKNLYDKLQINSRTQAVALYLKSNS